MAATIAWSQLSLHQLNNYYSSESPCQYLANELSLSSTQRDAILLDMYTSTLQFAQEIHLTPIQTSTFFSIMSYTHKNTTSSSFINFNLDFDYFKNLLLTHSIHRPPKSERIFTLEQVDLITRFATNGYFAHYLMYKYAFTRRLLLDLNIGQPAPPVEPIAVETEPEIPSEQIAEPEAPVLQQEVLFENEDYVDIQAGCVAETVEVDNSQTDAPQEVVVEPVIVNPVEKATSDLRQYILNNLSKKVDELKVGLMQKMERMDAEFSALKKMEGGKDEAKDVKSKVEAKDVKGGKKGGNKK